MYATVFIALAVVLLLFTGCTQYYQSKEDLYQEGMKMIDARNPAGAIVFFKNALERDQNYFEARFQLARAYAAVGKFDVSEKELQKVARQDPHSREVWVELARALVYQAKADEALKALGDIMSESPDADAQEIAGLAHAVNGNYDGAEAMLTQALARDPRRRTALLNLAKVYFAVGKMEAAKKRIEELLRKDPYDRDGLSLLAELQRRSGKTSAAIQSWEQLIAHYPSDVEAHLRMGLLQIEQGNYDEARTIASMLRAKFPNRPEGYHLTGVVSLQTRDLNGAVSAFQKTVTLQPDTLNYFLLGLSLYQTNDLELALSQLRRALELDPSYHRARLLLAAVHLKKQRLDAAIEEVQIVLREDGEDAAAHTLLGSAYMAKGMFPEAMAQLNRALEINPKAVDVRIKKGLFSLSRGNAADAEAELVNAVQLAPDMVNARLVLATYYLRQRAYSKAIDTLGRGLRGDEADTVLHMFIAGIHMRQNDFERAVDSLRRAKAANAAYLAPSFVLAQLANARGKYDDALQELQAVLTHAPANVRALLGCAAILELLGKDRDAYRYYRQAQDTGALEAYAAMAKYYVRNKEHKKAKKVLRRALEQYPSEALPYELEAMIYLSKQKYKQALKTLEKLEEIRPGRALPAIVTIYLRMNRPEQSLRRIRKELRRYPENMNLLTEMVRIHGIMGNTQAAVMTAEDMISKHPQAIAGYRALAMAYQAGDQIDKAIQLLTLQPAMNAEVAILLGNLHAARDENDAALEWYRKAEGLKPGKVQAIFLQGALQHRTGNRKEALAAYTRVLAIADAHVQTLNNIAYLHAEQNQELAKALQFATRAYIAAPSDGNVLDTLGFVLLKQKRPHDAVKLLTRAATLIRDEPTVYYHLALAYNDLGNTKLTVENLRKALEHKDFQEARAARHLLAGLAVQ